MPPPPHSKPENVLKRAQELVGVGQAQAALNLLHEHVVSKRTRNSPIAALEPVMKLFVELCVDLRKGKLAKDGLYQYKNTAQNTNVGTIETVFKHFIGLAENKVTEAQAKSDEVQSTATTSNIDDLEASETPESILLSTVSGEQSKDRTDRAIVTPWLKFLWETYRTVLDIFKNNARLEIMYQSTAHQAFQFCSKYARKTEFRRLCELLRNHLQNAAKFSSQMHAINLSDPDTLQRHLDTRFQQLNVAVELELWQEAFRSIEDIYTLVSLSKRPPKNIMMANYYQNLTKIFLVSENYLFHAAAWSRHYNLMRQSAAAVSAGQGAKKDNPSVTEADMTKAASFVLLSALSIPVISTHRSRGALVDVDEAKKNKNVRLTNLLGMNTAPTRTILFKDALSKGLLRRARPEIRELYNILEVDFHPLSICRRISPILEQIGADEEMKKYVQPLQQVILTRLFQQLSQVYDSVQIDFVLGLAQFPNDYQVSKSTIEKFIMNGCKKGDLAIRVDHASGVLTFDSDVFSSAKALHPGSGAGSAEETSVQRLQSTPAEIVRSQLTRLAKALYTTCQYVDPSFNASRHAAKVSALERAKAGADKEREETLARRAIIEKKKQAASSAQAKKDKEEQTKKMLRAQQAMEEEQKRLREEQKEREAKRLQAEQQKIQREEIEKQIKELKKDTKIAIDLPEDLSSLDSTRIRVLKLQALEKEKNLLGDQLRITGKRIDHLERAYRREELKHLSKDYEAQKAADRKAYDDATKTTLAEHKEKHREAVELKHRLGRLVPQYQEFIKEVRENRKAQFEKQKKAAEKELNQKIAQRIKEVKERRAREKREAEEAARREREEQERIEREEEEAAREAEEKRARMAEEKRIRDEERAKAAEQARRQLEREEEAAARRAAEKRGGAAAAPRTFERAEPRAEPAAIAPPRVFGDKKPSWREREAAKLAAGGSDTASPVRDASPAAAAPTEGRTGGAWVPPSRRGADAGGAAPAGGRWRDREDSGRGAPARTESPATGPGRYEPRRGFGNRDGPPREDRPREDRPREELRAEPPPPVDAASAGGKYRPGMFKQKKEGA